MAVKDFLAPTRGRILIFVVIFILVFLYDTAVGPFPGSPVVENLGTQEGATSFLLYILVLPYILSCLLPAFFGLRKRKFFRISTLTEFMHPRPDHHPQKPSRQQTFVFPSGTPVESSSMTPAAMDSLDSVEESSGPGSSGAMPAKASPAKPAARKPAKPAARVPRKGLARKPARKSAAKKPAKK